MQFVSKKLLFAEVVTLLPHDLSLNTQTSLIVGFFSFLSQDRKVTIKQFEELLNTKVAPKELVDDIQVIIV